MACVYIEFIHFGCMDGGITMTWFRKLICILFGHNDIVIMLGNRRHDYSLIGLRWNWILQHLIIMETLKVTEIGWWCDTATEEDDTEVGIDAHDSGDNEPGVLLGKAVFTKTTGAGWKKATVNIAISPNTI